MVNEIVKKIVDGDKFPTHGGESGAPATPLAAVLSGRPAKFAAGVDVAEVVKAVLEEAEAMPTKKRLDKIRSDLFRIANSYAGDETGHITVRLHYACNLLNDIMETLR